MVKFAENIYTLDEFSKLVENEIFGFKNMPSTDLLDSFDGVKRKAEKSEENSRKIMKSLFDVSDEQMDMINEKFSDMLKEDNGFFQEKITVGTNNFIHEFFEDKTIEKDGYCLKTKIVGKAVQLRNDENMLGFVAELIEGDSRFLMVVFGEEDGAVKIDIDELKFE